MNEAHDVPAERPSEEPWEQAVREKLVSLAQEPLTAQSAGRISEFAKTAGKLVSLCRDELPPSTKKPSPTSLWGGLGDPGDYPVPVSVPNRAETFGAKVLREILAAIPSIQRKGNPTAMVRAIVEAQQSGLNDVAEQLRRDLMGDVEVEEGELQLDDGDGETGLLHQDGSLTFPNEGGGTTTLSPEITAGILEEEA